MSTTLVAALVVPWVFWCVLMGFLFATGRSWVNMLLIPAGITVVILAVASLSTDREAFWASLILHLFLLVFFLGSFVSFVLRECKKTKL